MADTMDAKRSSFESPMESRRSSMSTRSHRSSIEPLLRFKPEIRLYRGGSTEPLLVHSLSEIHRLVHEHRKLVAALSGLGAAPSPAHSAMPVTVDTSSGSGGAGAGEVFWIDVEIPTSESGLTSAADLQVVGLEMSGALHPIRNEAALAEHVDGEAVLAALQGLFHLHPLTVRDITGQQTLDKFEVFDNQYTFAVAYEPDFNDGFNPAADATAVAIVLLSEAVLTVHVGTSRSVTRALSLARSGRLPSNAHLFAAVLAGTALLYGSIVDQIETDVKAMCEIVLLLTSSERADLLRRLVLGRRRISTLLKVLGPKREMLRRLVQDGCPHLPSAVMAFVRDPIDHTTRMKLQLKAVSSLLESSLTTYSIRMSVESNSLSQRINASIQRYTAIGTVLLPLTLMTNLLGMNIPIPSHPINAASFFGVVGVCVGFAILCVVVFRIKRMI